MFDVSILPFGTILVGRGETIFSKKIVLLFRIGIQEQIPAHSIQNEWYHLLKKSTHISRYGVDVDKFKVDCRFSTQQLTWWLPREMMLTTRSSHVTRFEVGWRSVVHTASSCVPHTDRIHRTVARRTGSTCTTRACSQVIPANIFLQKGRLRQQAYYISLVACSRPTDILSVGLTLSQIEGDT